MNSLLSHGSIFFILLTGTVASLVPYFFFYSSHTFSIMEKKIVLDFVERLLSRSLATELDVVDIGDNKEISNLFLSVFTFNFFLV
jgi:hypothetical protein